MTGTRRYSIRQLLKGAPRGASHAPVRRAPRLRCEALEDRTTPAILITADVPLAGGSLDLALLDGIVTADEAVGNQTLSVTALTAAAALGDVSITSPDGITFADLGLPLALPNVLGNDVLLETVTGDITFLDTNDLLLTAGGALEFVAAGGDLVLGSLTAALGGIGGTAAGNITVNTLTSLLGSNIDLDAGIRLTVGGPFTNLGTGTITLDTPVLDLNLGGLPLLPMLSLDGTRVTLDLGTGALVSLPLNASLNVTGGTMDVSIDLADRGFQNGSANPDVVTVSTTADGVLTVTARDNGGAPVTLFSGAASGVRTFTIEGSADRESLVIDETNPGIPELVVNGNDPSAAPGDALTVNTTNATGTAQTPGATGTGTFTFSNRNTITYTGIEGTSSAPTNPGGGTPGGGTPGSGRATPGRFATATTTGAVVVFDTGSANPTLLISTGLSGGAVAIGDVNGDGVGDITVVASSGAPLVRVFDGVTGAERLSFLAFGGFPTGGTISLGDLDGDGRAEIVIGAASLVSAVGVYDGQTGAQRNLFFAYGAAPIGVNVATGDLDGDGSAEIITGTRGIAPLVLAFAGNGTLVRQFLAFGQGGVTVGAADTDGDGTAEIITGTNLGGARPRAGLVGVFGSDTALRRFALLPPFPTTVGQFGPPVAGADWTGDGKDDVAVTVGPFVGVFDGPNFALAGVILPFPGVADGIHVG